VIEKSGEGKMIIVRINKLFAIIISLILVITVYNCSDSSDLIIKGQNIEIHFDRQLQSKVVATFNSQELQLGDFSPTEFVVIDSMEIKDFNFDQTKSERIIDSIGPAEQYTITGNNPKLKKQISVLVYDDFPDMICFSVKYTNSDTSDLQIQSWTNHNYTLKSIRPDTSQASFWSYMGASYGWNNDWVRPLRSGFKRENYMGMNREDCGGGTPIVDLWRPDVGLAVGHVETSPKLVSLPVTMPNDSSATVAVVYNKEKLLKPGQSFSTFRTFVAVHKGDFFNSLSEYSRFMQKQGFTFKEPPATAYETIWCGWGYGTNFTVEDIENTLPKVKEMGIDWAVLDYGWAPGEGDFEISKEKFPTGEKGMKKLIDDIHDAGAKAKLWIAPLLVHPETKLFKEHPEYVILNKDGSKPIVQFWHSYMLCPAIKEVKDLSRDNIVKAMKNWGWEGLKIDGNHLNGMPPCYNPAHNHAYPEESVEQVPIVFKMIYETALSINPEAVVEICPCGQTYSFYTLPYMNQSVSSDPRNSWQIRHKGKTLIALSGGKVIYYGDHVELSDEGSDFASTIGLGGVPGTKFIWPPREDNPKRRRRRNVSLTAERQIDFAKWFNLYNEKMLSKGKYRGELYDIGFDRPEAHVVQKGDTLYYSFYAEDFDGELELRGLKNQNYNLNDYFNNIKIGKASASKNHVKSSFKGFKLIEAVPENKN
jgi:alpha-galactosidase